MAIAQMAKVMIVSHRTQVSELLEALQAEGICQILNADDAVVSRDFPELGGDVQRPKDIETLLNRLQKSIAFLDGFSEVKKGLAAALAPRIVVDEQAYDEVVCDRDVLRIIDESERLESSIEATKTEIENLQTRLETLEPWVSLESPVEEIGRLWQTICLAGLIPAQQFDRVRAGIEELGAAVQQIGSANNKYACLIVCLNENIDETQKLLRSAEFESANFEPMTGTVADLMSEHTQKLDDATQQLRTLQDNAALLSENLLKLQILHDHYDNLLNRDRTRDTAPATEHTVILEAWVKKHDYARLEKIVSLFEAASIAKVKPAEDEKIPVEIENKGVIKPFEVITRLYGMPQHFEVDPTVFLAPFFALFFGLCLTDAGYGIVMVALVLLFVRKMQGDKKLMWMLGICGAVTVVTGALTGGWFGNAVQQFVPGMKGKDISLWFDPFKFPMTFFYLALALGYFQIMTGLAIAFGHNLKRKDYIAAVCDQLTWLVMLNSLVLLLAGNFVGLPAWLGKVCTITAIIPAAAIFLFSHREGGWAGRLGMGLYNLFSTIFFMGDVLSYLRLMALGMVTAGLAMAINVIAEIAGQIPYGIGIVAMALVLIGGHGFNMAINALGAFVHTLRLQYVEFFPKFLIGGGKLFEPLSKKYEHISIRKSL